MLDPHVSSQVTGLPRPVGAQGALVGLLPSVHPVVVPEMVEVIELLAARGAPVPAQRLLRAHHVGEQVEGHHRGPGSLGGYCLGGDNTSEQINRRDGQFGGRGGGGPLHLK